MKVEMHVFDQLPVHDTCWSIITGADNNVYAAACCEYVGGCGTFLVRYNTKKRKIEYMLDIAEAVGQPPENGRATQCKLHYSLLSDDDGLLYGATHLSAPGRGERYFSPWICWKDAKRGFPGAHLFIYDPSHERVLFTDNIAPNEGCRCLAMDRERGLLYGITYPRNHFFVYDLESKKRTDIGRIGNVNPQCIFLDDKNRAYTNDDYGRFMRFDIATGRFEKLDVYAPHAPYQNGLHTILYDVVKVPGEPAVLGIPWCTDPHFFKYTYDNGKGAGKLEDLGPSVSNKPGFLESRVQTDHTGGLVFGKDGMLYYCANMPVEKDIKTLRRGVDNVTFLMRMNPRTGKKEKLKRLQFGDFTTWYVSRAVRDEAGILYLGDVGNIPNRMYRVDPGYGTAVKKKKEPKDIAMRYWG